MDQEIHKTINWLGRDEIIAILERYGVASYDAESTDDKYKAFLAAHELKLFAAVPA